MFLLHQSQLPLDPSTWPQTASGPPERLPHCRARCPVWPASAPTPAQQVLEDLQALKPTVFRRKSGDDRMSGDEIGWYGSTLSTTNGWVNTNTNMEEFCRLIDIQIVAHSLARWDICLRFSLRQHFHLGKIYTDNDIGCPSNLMESSWLCFSLNEPELGTWNSRRCILFPLMFKKKLGKFSSSPKPHMTSWPLPSWKEMVSFNADDLKWSCQLWSMFGLYNHPIWVPIEFHFGYLTRPWKVWSGKRKRHSDCNCSRTEGCGLPTDVGF